MKTVSSFREILEKAADVKVKCLWRDEVKLSTQKWTITNSGFLLIGLGITLLGGGDIILVKRHYQSVSKAAKIMLNDPIAGPIFTGGFSALLFHIYWRCSEIT